MSKSKPFQGAATVRSQSEDNTQIADQAVASKIAGEIRKSDGLEEDVVVFVSTNEEAQRYDVNLGDAIINGTWDTRQRHLVWRVPSNLIDRFSRHFFVTSGRIVRGG